MISATGAGNALSVAAGVSGGEPIRIGIESSKLAIAAFIIPYIFVLSPELLMIDSTWMEVIWVVFTAMFGIIIIGAGVIGYWMRGMHWLERILAVIVGLLLIYPESISDITGIIMLVVLLTLQYVWKRNNNNKTKMFPQA